MLLILALVFTSLCSSATPVHAATQTISLGNGFNAIFTYSMSSSAASTTVTLTKVQLQNKSGKKVVWKSGELAMNKPDVKFYSGYVNYSYTEVNLVSDWNGTINNGATATLWSGSRSVTHSRETTDQSRQIAWVGMFMDSAILKITVPALPQYTITYEPNGGEGTAQTNTKYYGEHKGSDVTFRRPGYAFSKWTTNADGTGTSYTKDSTINVTSNTTLYAQWVPGITYNANGGLFSSTDPNVYYVTYKEEALTGSNTITEGPTWTGRDFLEWNTEKDGSGTSYAVGDSYTSMEPLALYAQWEEHHITLHYNANGGTGAPPDQTILYSKEARASEVIPTRPGFLFKGWATSKNAKVPIVVANGLYKPANTEPDTVSDTLYAIWQTADIQIKHRDLFSIGKSSNDPPTAKATTKDESQEYGDLKNIKGEGWQYEVF